MKDKPRLHLDRRRLLGDAALTGAAVALGSAVPAWAQTGSRGLAPSLAEVSGSDITLTIARAHRAMDGRSGRVITINGAAPAPLLRVREGQWVRLAVTNQLDEVTSIHWHGVLVPHQFDGVPGVSFPGIRPGETFVYEFPIKQSGTYWYHSHSGLQEQEGHHGPIIFDPRGPDPVAYDREHVLLLSDYSFMDPHTIFTRLKQESDVFNFQHQTVESFLQGRDQPLRERVQWARMRMDPTDISDVTGATYTYLINGYGPRDNWTALFRPGERVRLRFINASAMTIFNVRVPSLVMQVVQADGQNVKPVDVDEFQISVAETFDVIVRPTDDRAYTVVAEAVDRSGLGRATLAPRMGMSAAVPTLRERPLATMRDMGMSGMNMARRGAAENSAGMEHAGHGAGMEMSGMNMARPGARENRAGVEHAGRDMSMDMHGMDMDMRDPANAPQVVMGPGVQMIAPMPVDRMGDRGKGLEDVDHRVLVYTDLEALEPNPDARTPSRSLELHLTGNMERFMWSFDGQRFNEVTAPIPFRRDERVRVTLVNDSMMSHPIHIHGHFFELLTGSPGRRPRKHTVNVLPGGKVTFDLTANAPGDWAFHCHLLYHMHAGMFRVVSVRPLDEPRA